MLLVERLLSLRLVPEVLQHPLPGRLLDLLLRLADEIALCSALRQGGGLARLLMVPRDGELHHQPTRMAPRSHLNKILRK